MDKDTFRTEVQLYRHQAPRLVCKAFNEEILELFYKGNGFEFSMLSVLLDFLLSIGKDARSWLKKIRIHFSLNYNLNRTDAHEKAAALRAYKTLRYLLSCPHFEHLEINARVKPIDRPNFLRLSYPVLDPKAIFLSTNPPDTVDMSSFGQRKILLFLGPEFIREQFQPHPNDEEMAGQLKRVLAKALCMILDERAAKRKR